MRPVINEVSFLTIPHDPYRSTSKTDFSKFLNGNDVE
jgi:hypothetical protein